MGVRGGNPVHQHSFDPAFAPQAKAAPQRLQLEFAT